MPLRIEDYALIGNTRTAALVGKDGSIDWMCVPRFDSNAVFAALLGDQGNGHWQIGPARGVAAARRAYRKNTLILETELETAD
ncbi:MAG TPA: trehalase-like domain-containing protein, partial [Casimicrobiaceae bacterium]|nr:trehalase-like domain-containing protein [Casimicrobiaceae bacterium]